MAINQLRRDPVTGRWTIIVMDQPDIEKLIASNRRPASPNTTCPFCEGNEKKTPPEPKRKDAQKRPCQCRDPQHHERNHDKSVKSKYHYSDETYNEQYQKCPQKFIVKRDERNQNQNPEKQGLHQKAQVRDFRLYRKYLHPPPCDRKNTHRSYNCR